MNIYWYYKCHKAYLELLNRGFGLFNRFGNKAGFQGVRNRQGSLFYLSVLKPARLIRPGWGRRSLELEKIMPYGMREMLCLKLKI